MRYRTNTSFVTTMGAAAALVTLLAVTRLTLAWQDDLMPLRTLPLGEYNIPLPCRILCSTASILVHDQSAMLMSRTRAGNTCVSLR